MTWLFAKRLRSFVLLAGAASLILNVALLMPALYMMQVFDRVFASGSVETLVMLSAITLLFLVLSWFLDVARTRSLGLAGRSLDRLLSPAAIRSALEQASSGPGRADADALRDIALVARAAERQRRPCPVRRALAAGLSARHHAHAPVARPRGVGRRRHPGSASAS